MRLNSTSIALLVILSILPSSLLAENIDAIFKKVESFVQQENYSKALSELEWAKKEIEKMHVRKLQAFFPEELSGFKGQKMEANSVLGFSNIERAYVQGAKKVSIALTGSSGDAAAGLGGLAQFGRMAAMFGGSAPGTETVRIHGRTTMVEEGEGRNASVTVMLDSNSILKLESSTGVKAQELKAMAEALKIEEMDAYLKGGK